MTLLRWLCVGLGILGFYVAHVRLEGNLLVSLSLSLVPITVLVGVERGLATAREQKASSLSESEFMLQKAGGPGRLRHQAILIRVCSYMVIAIALPALVVGILVATRGNLTAFFIALAAVFMLYGARVFLKAATRMIAAADTAPN